jgi:hypothetical protein
VRDAVLDELLGTTTADVLAKALDDLPETTEPGQVEGVLTGAVPELLSRWTARNALDPRTDPVADARAAAARQAISEGLAAAGASPAARLEAAYVLIGQAVAPAALVSQLQLIADALAPEQLLDREQACYDDRSAVLTKKRLQPGWRLRGDLTDEVGAALQAQLQARAAARARQEAALRKAARAGHGDPELFGTVGPGDLTDSMFEPAPWLGPDRLTHDLLGELHDDLTGSRASATSEAGNPDGPDANAGPRGRVQPRYPAASSGPCRTPARIRTPRRSPSSPTCPASKAASGPCPAPCCCPPAPAP